MPSSSIRLLAATAAFFLGAQLLSSVAFAQVKAAAIPVTPAASSNAADPKADPRATIVKKIDGLKLEDVRMSPISGLYEITRGSDVTYSSSDGRYIIVGDLIDVDSDSNLSEA